LKEQISEAIAAAIQQLVADGEVAQSFDKSIQVTRTKDASHGDFASNIALLFAKQVGKNPRELALSLSQHLTQSNVFDRVEVAGPGFINFFIAQKDQSQVMHKIFSQQRDYGKSELGRDQSVHIEYVSANPTGPLHVGHGRGAAYGATLANIYLENGFKVEREYYVNDAGRQMDILATSVWCRYLELCGSEISFPTNGYQGDYIWDIAATIHRQNATTYYVAPELFSAQLPPDEPQGGDKEVHIDALIDSAKQQLGEQGYSVFFNCAIDTILGDIKDDLHLFGVDYENWYSERSLFSSNKVTSAIAKLKASGHVYEDQGALWFASSQLGDEKDRVVVRDNGQPTYFASDIAYHADKFSKSYTHLINIWGADHHGYIARVRAAMQALGYDDKKLDVLLVQFANLYRGQERLQMSTRSGEFVTLRALRKEVGADAARFFYVMRKSEQHLDFDLELAASKSNENPVYYVQYAHARICSVLKQAQLEAFIKPSEESIQLLTQDSETGLMQKLADYEECVISCCHKQAPHLLVNYLRELAQRFHGYYNETQFIVDSEQVTRARCLLIQCVRQVLFNGLSILGVNAPEKM
tara:strand:+ start:2337 stop:4088 length:1752 start_codon:yes stop_codon:yes gene_type:complete